MKHLSDLPQSAPSPSPEQRQEYRRVLAVLMARCLDTLRRSSVAPETEPFPVQDKHD